MLHVNFALFRQSSNYHFSPWKWKRRFLKCPIKGMEGISISSSLKTLLHPAGPPSLMIFIFFLNLFKAVCSLSLYFLMSFLIFNTWHSSGREETVLHPIRPPSWQTEKSSLCWFDYLSHPTQFFFPLFGVQDLKEKMEWSGWSNGLFELDELRYRTSMKSWVEEGGFAGGKG